MKNYDEIKDIIVNRLGLKSMDDYRKYSEQFYGENPKQITKEDVELLSPDNVNCKDFWLVVEELFGSDCVSNTLFGREPDNIVESNRRNMMMAHINGTINLLHLYMRRPYKILEIGAGYGAFRNFVESSTIMEYTGVDVLPKIKGIEATKEDGTFTDEQKSRKYDIVYSSNVFQHFSDRQREQYISDVSNMLDEKGPKLFVMNIMLDLNVAEKYRAEDGNVYLCHYGQFTPIPTQVRVCNMLQDRYFNIHSSNINFYSRVGTFSCYLADKPKPEPSKQS